MPPQPFQCEERYCCDTQQKKLVWTLCPGTSFDSAAVLQPSCYQSDGRSAATERTLRRYKHLRLWTSEADTNNQRTSCWTFNPLSLSENWLGIKQPVFSSTSSLLKLKPRQKTYFHFNVCIYHHV